jgi:hypothetical protein
VSTISASVTNQPITATVSASGAVTASVGSTAVSVAVGGGIGPQGPQGAAGASSWNDITGKPATFPPESHAHGNITTAGAIGSTSGQIVVTTTSGVLTTAASIALSQLSQSSATNGQAITWSGTAWVATTLTAPFSGSYSDLTNRPTLGSAAAENTTAFAAATHASTHAAGGSDSLSLSASQVSDLAAVATSGSYADLSGTITLASGATIESIADGLRFNVGNSYLSYETGDVLSCRSMDYISPSTGELETGGINAIVCLSPIEFQITPGVATPMRVNSDGLRFPDDTAQTTAWTGSFSYDDLDDLPTLFSGAYADLSGAPSLATVATSGSYADLSGAPSLATVATSGSYADLSGAPSLATVATSGSYADLSGAPTLATVATSGSYADLSGSPSLSTVATSGSYADLSGAPSLATVATSGSYADLSGAPSLFSGSYDDLTSKPTLGTAAAEASTAFAAASHSHALSDLSQSGAATNQVPQWSGSAWVPATVSGGGGSSSASDLTSGTLSQSRLDFVPLHPFLLMGG